MLHSKKLLHSMLDGRVEGEVGDLMDWKREWFMNYYFNGDMWEEFQEERVTHITGKNVLFSIPHAVKRSIPEWVDRKRASPGALGLNCVHFN